MKIVDFDYIHMATMAYDDIKRFNDDHAPSFEELLNIYSKEKTFDDEFFTLLQFANFIVEKVKKDHYFGMKFPTSRQIALLFIEETVFGKTWIIDNKLESQKVTGHWEANK